MTTIRVVAGVVFLVLSLALRLVQQRSERSKGPYAKFRREPQRRMTLVRPSGTHFYKDKGDAA